MSDVIKAKVGEAEAAFFRRLNAVVIPQVRRGLGSPGRLPGGLVILDTVGRVSGRVYPIPVFASVVDDCLLVGTARARSQWLRNMAAAGEVQYWQGGERRLARSIVFAPAMGLVGSADGLPFGLRLLARAIVAFLGRRGGGFAILQPVARR